MFGHLNNRSFRRADKKRRLVIQIQIHFPIWRDHCPDGRIINNDTAPGSDHVFRRFHGTCEVRIQRTVQSGLPLLLSDVLKRSPVVARSVIDQDIDPPFAGMDGFENSSKTGDICDIAHMALDTSSWDCGRSVDEGRKVRSISSKDMDARSERRQAEADFLSQMAGAASYHRRPAGQ